MISDTGLGFAELPFNYDWGDFAIKVKIGLLFIAWYLSQYDPKDTNPRYN
jgi:hypothetical protein